MANKFNAHITQSLGGLLGHGLSTAGEVVGQKAERERQKAAQDAMMAQQQQELALKDKEKQERIQNFERLASGRRGEEFGGSNEGDIDLITQEAAALGLSPNDINQIRRASETRKKQSFAEDKFEREFSFKKEQAAQKAAEPERKIAREEIQKYAGRAEQADRKITDYKSLEKLIDKGDLRSGSTRQILGKFGLEGFLQSPSSEVAEKLLADINSASMMELSASGQLTDAKMKELIKTNPSLLQTPEGMKNNIKSRIIGEQAQKQVNAEINKIKKEAKKKDIPYPADIIDIAKERAQPVIEQIHEQQLELVDKIGQQEPPKPMVYKTLPDPKDFSEDDAFEDPVTGEVYFNEGGKWVRAT